MTITVVPVDDAPVAVADAAATDEDTPVTVFVLDNDGVDGFVDVDGELFYVDEVVSAPVHGSAVVTELDDAVVYTPAPDFNGSDSFTYRVIDDAGTVSEPVTVTVTVAPVNDAPSATAGAVSTDEDTPVVVALVGSDVDGDVLTPTVTDGPAHGVVSCDEVCTYTPAADWNGLDAVTFTVSDGQADSAPATVEDHGRAGQRRADRRRRRTVVTAEDTAVDLTLSGVDADGDPLTFDGGGPAARWHAGLFRGDVHLHAPAANLNGPTSFTFTVSDGSITSAPATVGITVTPVNDRPAFNPGGRTLTTEQNRPMTLADPLRNAFDVDGDTLALHGVGSAAHGTTEVVAGTIRYTPATGYRGSDAFTYTITDGTLTQTNLVTVTVAYAAGFRRRPRLRPTSRPRPDLLRRATTRSRPSSPRRPADRDGRERADRDRDRDGLPDPGDPADRRGAPATPEEPLVLTFNVDPSVFPGGVITERTLNRLWPRRDGVAISTFCVGGTAATSADPDPCVRTRALTVNGWAGMTVLTSHASEWTFQVDDEPATGGGGGGGGGGGWRWRLPRAGHDRGLRRRRRRRDRLRPRRGVRRPGNGRGGHQARRDDPRPRVHPGRPGGRDRGARRDRGRTLTLTFRVDRSAVPAGAPVVVFRNGARVPVCATGSTATRGTPPRPLRIRASSTSVRPGRPDGHGPHVPRVHVGGRHAHGGEHRGGVPRGDAGRRLRGRGSRCHARGRDRLRRGARAREGHRQRALRAGRAGDARADGLVPRPSARALRCRAAVRCGRSVP